MLNAPAADVRFCCPSCGINLRSMKSDGGTVILCRGCGETIRVPRSIPIQECRPVDVGVLSPLLARRTLEGLRLLRICLHLTIVQSAFVLAVYGLWLLLVGAPRIWSREAGDYRNVFYALWIFDLGLVAALSGYKWLGYHKCEAGADAVQSLGRLTLVRFAVIPRALGYAMAAIPWLTTNSAEGTPWSMRVAVQIGHVLWVGGVVTEYLILFVWSRLLTELSPGTEKIITRFLAWTAGLILTAVSAFSIVSMTVLVQLRQIETKPGQPPRVDLALLPHEGWTVLIGFAVFVALLALVSALQYDRVLRTLQNTVRSAAKVAN